MPSSFYLVSEEQTSSSLQSKHYNERSIPSAQSWILYTGTAIVSDQRDNKCKGAWSYCRLVGVLTGFVLFCFVCHLRREDTGERGVFKIIANDLVQWSGTLVNPIAIACGDDLRNLPIQGIKQFGLIFIFQMVPNWCVPKIRERKAQCTWKFWRNASTHTHRFQRQTHLGKSVRAKGIGRLHKWLLDTYLLEFCVLLTDVGLLESSVLQNAWNQVPFYIRIPFKPDVA